MTNLNENWTRALMAGCSNGGGPAEPRCRAAKNGSTVANASPVSDTSRAWASYESHAKFYHDVYGQHITASYSFGGAGTTVIEARQEAGDWSDAPTADLTVGWRPSRPVGLTCDLGAGRFVDTQRQNDAILIAPNAGSTILVDGTHVCRFVTVNYSSLLRLSGGIDSPLPPNGDFGPLHTGLLRDQTLSGLLAAFWNQARTERRDSLFADGLLLQIASTLLGLKDGSIRRSARGGLAPAQLRRVIECMDAQMGDDLSLEELAAHTGLSPNHFCTAFRQSTGEPPHRYLMRRRIKHACELLENPQLPVTEVALACGFASSAHFATAFRKATGASPSAYRRERLF